MKAPTGPAPTPPGRVPPAPPPSAAAGAAALAAEMKKQLVIKQIPKPGAHRSNAAPGKPGAK
jgi:hypothetical protein